MLLLCALIVGCVNYGWADVENVTVTSATITSTNFTISSARNTGTSSPTYNSGDSGLRLYPNNTLSIASKDHENITSITLSVKCNTGGKSKVYPTGVSASTGAITSGGTPGSTVESIVWSGSAESVVFTINGSAGNVSVKAISITYTPAAIPVTSITLNKDELTLAVGENETLLVSEVLPATATDKTVTWSSSKSSVASVNSSTGVVTAHAVGGPVTITATANDGSGVTATCAVTVVSARVDVTGVTLNKTATTLFVGETETLTATIAPADATNKNVVWTSSDDAVASVDEDGVVTANAVGTATITATSEENEGIKATCTVTVNPVVVTGVTLNKTSTSIMFGSTETLTATVAPANATNKNVTWTSSNTSVATVSEGVITPVSVGTTTITVTTEDQDMTATCDVTITQNNVKPSLTEEVFEETFANVTGTGAADVSKFDNTGWSKVGDVYGASGDGVRMAKNGGGGSLTTPALSTMTNNGILTFMAKGWNSNETSISISGTNCTVSPTSFSDLSHESFTKKTVSITVTGSNPTITFTAASGERVYIDDIKIVQTASSIDVTLNASGFASYCSPFALDLTPGGDVAAYAVKTIGDNKVKFTKITGKVAANTPFILYNTDKASEAVSLPIIEDDDAGIAPVTDNALIGTLSPTYTVAPSGYTNFGLSGSKFVPMNDGVVKKNKAYLQVDNSDIDADAGAHSLEIVFDDGETTGIQSVNGSGLKVNDYFDLQGRRVAQPTRGLYIVNGKKVVIK